MLRFLMAFFYLFGLLNPKEGGGLSPDGIQSIPPPPPDEQGSGWDPWG